MIALKESSASTMRIGKDTETDTDTETEFSKNYPTRAGSFSLSLGVFEKKGDEHV